MSFRLHLILVLSSTLVGNQKATSRIARERPLRDFFVCPVLSTSIELRWDWNAFYDVDHEILTMTVAATSDPNNTMTAHAKLSDGGVSLDGLTPNTSYIVTAIANIGENTTLALRNTIHTPANGTDTLHNYFFWGPVTNQSMRLSWDQPDSKDTFNATITLMSWLPTPLEEITVDGLTPGTLYIATVTVLQEGRQFFNSKRYIRTLESGHGGVTVVTTSGSGIASAILGLLLTCTVLVLA
eukprot:TsM_000794200 transcript=TsM_000794200 gene=TsM_000794200